MEPQLFRRFAQLAYDKAGISLKAGKEALVQARVAKRVRALRLSDAGAYLDYLEAGEDGDELLEFLDAISTHFTSFFREKDHFEELAREALAAAAAGRRRFRFWSAASSTGEEPYSLAMTLQSQPGWDRIDWKILATDVAAHTLAQAQAGRYDAARVAPVPGELARRFLRPVTESDKSGERKELFEVDAAIKDRVRFGRINLARPPFPMKGPFDAVLCRNVLIYFDQPTRQRLIQAIEGLLRPGGLLCVGHTETLNAVQTGLRVVRPSVYRKPLAEGER